VFSCKRFHPKCRANCCGCFPFSKTFYEKNKHRVVNEPIELKEFVAPEPPDLEEIPLVIPVTEDGSCPFLKGDMMCAIYDDRPYVCREFGCEKTKTLTCPHQDANGRTRSRQEMRKIDRETRKEILQSLKGLFKRAWNKNDPIS